MIYISGPMKGIPNDNREAFWEAEKKIKEKTNDLIFNPANFPMGWTREEYLRKDIEGLCQCNVMVLLPGFEKSDGCKLEMNVAVNIGIPIFSFDDYMNDRLFRLYYPKCLS